MEFELNYKSKKYLVKVENGSVWVRKDNKGTSINLPTENEVTSKDDAINIAKQIIDNTATLR
ncbi:MAG: hypothetical protein CMO34_03685 [Verrucomicrobia bacterium]|nr:hypothetical protein [Verrucomicrobiota bacterium]|tara:strand:- start:226 stop:411 length:186 start_codon:yes stop_codon:yes gene_type:complete